MSRGRATAVGFSAVLMWALLAVLAVASGDVPPFQLAALCFTIGGLIGVGAIVAQRKPLDSALPSGLPAWALGVGGLFGYHFFYFTAIRNAPPAQASLIAYLWPLLIVLISGLLPGERLRPGHVVGAATAFAGAAVILAPAAMAGFSHAHALGYGAAMACALIWSGYSVLSRRFGQSPSSTVAGSCLAAALLAALCHLVIERTVWPQDAGQWLAVALLGLGPVGGAFHVWDVGVKHGDLQLLGTAAYAAPLLSTATLVLVGIAAPSLGLGLAALLIAGGAALAASAGRRPRRT